MTVMLLALALADAALNAHEMQNYRVSDQQEAGGSADITRSSPSQSRAWTPGIADWDNHQPDCPIFFQQELRGFGTFRVGPRCSAESPK